MAWCLVASYSDALAETGTASVEAFERLGSAKWIMWQIYLTFSDIDRIIQMYPQNAENTYSRTFV